MFRILLFLLVCTVTPILGWADEPASAYGFDLFYGYTYETENGEWILETINEERLCKLIFNLRPDLEEEVGDGDYCVVLGRRGRYPTELIVHDLYYAWRTYGRVYPSLLGYEFDDYYEEYGSDSKILHFTGNAADQINKLKTSFVSLTFFIPDGKYNFEWEVVDVGPDFGENREYHVGMLRKENDEYVLFKDGRNYVLKETTDEQKELFAKFNDRTVKVLGFERAHWANEHEYRTFMVEKIEGSKKLIGRLEKRHTEYVLVTPKETYLLFISYFLRNELIEWSFPRHNLLNIWIDRDVEIWGTFLTAQPMWIINWPKEEPLDDGNRPAFWIYDIRWQRADCHPNAARDESKSEQD